MEPDDDKAFGNLSRRIAALSPAKRALLEHGLKGKQGILSRDPPQRVGRTSVLLSFAQQRLWFMDRLQAGSAGYNIPEALLLRGTLNVNALERAINAIAERHESLRTHFIEVDGKPFQVIVPFLSVELPLEDLSGLESGVRAEKLAFLLREELETPFLLDRGPLLRLRLFKLDVHEHLLAYTFHHIISDGWSMVVFRRELSVLYKTFHEGAEPRLESLPMQYADYALWQRRRMEGPAGRRLLDYWNDKLADAPPLLDIPTDNPRPAHHDDRGESRALKLSPELTESLSALSRREGVTLFMTLLAAFKLLLSRLSGQEDIVVGTPMSGRDDISVENLIGLFINTLVLRTDLSGNPGFTEALRRVRATVLGAFEHQDLPFEQLIEKLQPQRDLNHTPLIQYVFNMISFTETLPALAGLAVDRLEPPVQNAKFDFTLYATNKAEGLLFLAVYNTSLFRGGTIERMLQQLHHLLEQIAEKPQQRIQMFCLRTAQTQRLLPDPEAAIAEFPGIPVFRQFIDISRTCAANPAVRHEGREWSYQQLAEASRRIAKQLVADGVRPGDVVVVSGRRSFGLVASILGVLGSRGVLFLMDPALPSSRRNLMLQEACGRHWLHVESNHDEEAWSDAFRKLPTTQISTDGVLLNTTGADGAATVAPADSALHEPCYVFFTSGTAGKPKAILGSHKGLRHFIDWERQTLDMRHDDRVAQLTGLSFDVVLRDILLPLTSGATLCLPDEEMTTRGDRLVPWLRREGITIVHAVPSLAQTWLDCLPSEMLLPELRWVLFAGEPLTDLLVGQWRKLIGGNSGIINLYGPTETTLAKCFHVIPPTPRLGVQPIGQALPCTQTLVLNRENQLCGIGEPGEIAIRTPFRSLGYLNGTDQDRARFSVNPFRDDPSDLIYRTGDRGIYADGGVLQILGRCDDQLKIRGARVEPEEICAALAKHGGIRRSVVMARENTPTKTSLVAYLVPEEHRSALDVKEIRNYLKTFLPDYMIPSRFVVIPALPLTPNGKVDRKALALLDGVVLTPSVSFEGPRTERERRLVEIWQALLNREPIGIHDNFFELGGHSLLAMRVIARMRAALNQEISLRRLFEFPTIAGLAGYLASQHGASDPPLSPLGPSPRDGSLPLSFAQQRLWFLDRFEGAGAAYHIHHTMHLRGDLNRAALGRAIDAIVARHESLRTRFIELDSEATQIIASATGIDLPLEDLSLLAEEQRKNTIATILRRETVKPFDLSQGPLLRARVLKLGEQEHLLALVFHHIVTDGWSLGIFNRELSALYASFCTGQEDPLQPLTVQYADYTLWQRRWLQGEELERQLSHWRNQLADAPTLAVATDRPRPQRLSYAGARHAFTISSACSARLKDFNQAENLTPFMSLLAAFQVLLSRYSGQTDILVGTPIANRRRMELEGLIGFFVNTLVLRTDLSGNPDFRTVAARVRETALDAYAHQDLPFERLVEEINPDRDLGRHPIFQVLFALQNVPTHPPALVGLDVTSFPSPVDTTHFDLELHFRTEGDSWFGSFSYNTDLFDAATIRQLAGHYQTLLEGLLKEPERPVDEVPLLTAAERHRILVAWNDTRRDYPRGACIHELFEDQARCRPDAVALELGAERMTYGELSRRSDHVARHLRGFGVQPGDVVGVNIARSIERVAGLLGILKAGAAYWAVEENIPAERLRMHIGDARPKVMLTRGTDADFPADIASVKALEELWAAPPEQVVGAARPIRPDDPAYVSYTSGSTGRPKGVVVPHRGVVRLVKGADYASLSSEETLLHISPLSFDASTFELWGALLNGGRVVLLPPGRPSLAEIGVAIRRHGVTTVWLTAGLFHLMVDERLEDLKPLRQLLAGGDVLCPKRVAKARAALPGCRLVNGYGPTENTTFTCCYTVADEREPTWRVPIGRPITNTRVYILDRHLQPVPVGVAGELYAGGDGVACGYLNQPALTAERFIPDPFTPESGSRLYRTGDRVRWLPDGTVEYLGRMDYQVKIRGYRVELEEIEAALRACAGVRDALVIRREDLPVDRSLVGYVVVSDGTRVSVDELRDRLRERLPEYMLPAAFVVLENVPLLPNGKLDRRNLPRPQDDGDDPAGTCGQPKDLLEMELIRIWQRLFNRPGIGRHDNFFKLGGHSLLALRLAAEIDKLLDRKLPIAVLFQSPTIESLARWLTEEAWAPPWSSLVPLQPLGSKPPFFLVHGWGGDVFGFLGLAHLLAPDQPTYGLQAVGLDGKAARHTTIESMAAHYAEEIRSFQPEGPYYLGGYSMGGLIAYEVAQHLQRRGQRVALLALLDSAPGGVFPWVFAGLRMAAHIRDRCLVHIRQWWQLPLCERAAYFRERWASLRRWIVLNRPKPAPVIAPPGQDSLPPHVPGFNDYYVAVASAYRPQRYPGKADVFVSSETKSSWRWCWRYLARGGVSFHRIPARHLQFLSPEFLPILARSLTAVLDRAQGKARTTRLRRGCTRERLVS